MTGVIMNEKTIINGNPTFFSFPEYISKKVVRTGDNLFKSLPTPYWMMDSLSSMG